MLPTSAIVEHVLATGDDTVMAGMKPGTVVIEMSSGVPSVTQLLAERVMELGGHMIDAPVSGGVPRAKTGELAIMVGGDPAIIDLAMPVLSAMGTSVLRTGAVGSGQAMKALNNLVSAGGFLIGIEALLIGQRFGLDPAVMVDVLDASTQKKFKQFVLAQVRRASPWGCWRRICRACRWARDATRRRCRRSQGDGGRSNSACGSHRITPSAATAGGGRLAAHRAAGARCLRPATAIGDQPW